MTDRSSEELSALRVLRRVAAPSWVMPGTMEENCIFLAGQVDEVGLLFLQSSASLAHGRKELPYSLAELPLTFHLHLPLDLSWQDPAGAAEVCAALLEKTSFLAGREHGLMAVLHPPDQDPADRAQAGRLLAAFARRFIDCGGELSSLLLENTAGNDLLDLEGFIIESGLGLCPDMGHMLAYGQERLLKRERLLARAAMLHVNATARDSGRHLPLQAFDRRERLLARRLCNVIPPRAVVMLELFHWQDILDSLPLMRSWLLPDD